MTDEDFHSVIRAINELTVGLTGLVSDLNTWTASARENQAVQPARIAKALLATKETHKALDEATKALYHVKDALEKNVLPKRLEEQGLDFIRVPEVARSFSVQNRISASFLDRERGHEWLRSIGQGDMITETVNAGTLSSFVKSLQEEQGIDPPDDIVKVSAYETISINKYTPK